LSSLASVFLSGGAALTLLLPMVEDSVEEVTGRVLHDVRLFIAFPVGIAFVFLDLR
jgi:hypothetical protein